MPPTKVLYVVAPGRSGTTLLNTLLNRVEGVFGAGELQALWIGATSNKVCGCGLQVRDCELWKGIIDRVLTQGNGDWTPQVLRAQQEGVGRPERTARLLRARPGSSDLKYADVMAPLFGAIAEATNSQVIVDVSKQPQMGALLARADGIDARFLHLVRDPRAVVYSWSRRPKDNPEADTPLPRFSVNRSALHWTRWNLGAERLRRFVGNAAFLRLRYEDLLEHPNESLESVLRLCGLDQRIKYLDGAEPGENHTVGGNPIRFDRGPIRLRMDDEWRSAQSLAEKLIATFWALPLLHRYGYRLLS